jgi:Fe(3+) dicitrate transport protein
MRIGVSIGLILLNFKLVAHGGEEFDSLNVTKLKGVEIVDHRLNTSPRNNQEIENTVIFAGKKNELVNLTNNTFNTVDNSARQIFSQIPGITVWESDGSGIQVGIASRGLNPNRSWEFNVRQNGYDISSDPFGYPEAYYSPPMEAVSRIQIVRGASSIQFGPQFGGLLNYFVYEAPKDKKIQFKTMQTVGSFGMFNSYNQLGGTIKNFSYFGFYNFKRADGFRPNSKYYIHNGFLKLAYNFKKNWKLSAENSVMDYVSQQPGGLTDAQFADKIKQSSRGRNWMAIRWIMPSVNLSYNTEKHSVDFKVFGLIGDRNSNAFVRPINVNDTINQTTGQYNNRQIDIDKYRNIGAEIRYAYHYNLGKKKQDLAIGGRYFYGHTKRTTNGKGDTRSEYNITLEDSVFGRNLDFKSQNFALFAENVFRVGNFAIVPGIRLEILQNTANGYISRNTTTGGFNFMTEQNRWRYIPIAGLGLEYHIKSFSELYANASQAYRPVLFSDLTPGATTDSISQDLTDANGFNFDLGYRGKLKDWLEFDVSGFYVIYNNRVGTIAQQRENGTAYQLRKNLGNSHSRGAEIFISFDPLALSKVSSKLGNFKIWTSISYTNAIYTQLSSTKIEGGVVVTTDLSNKKVENAPEFTNRFGATYSYRFFEVNYVFHWVGGSYADATNQREPNAAATLGYIPSYYVMDLNLSMNFLKDRLNVKAGVSNLTNSRYFTRRAGGYPGPGILPAEPRSFFMSLGFTL